jgi:hypothetical protein
MSAMGRMLDGSVRREEPLRVLNAQIRRKTYFELRIQIYRTLRTAAEGQVMKKA